MAVTAKLFATLLSVLVAIGGVVPSAQSQSKTGFRVTHVRVFDGERVHERTDVAVEQGIIRALGRDVAKWQHLPQIDGTGATLMPGLIDAHVHMRDAAQLRQAVRFGVTTVLDLGAIVEPDVLFALRAAAKAAPDMADLRVAGYAATTLRPNQPVNLLTRSTPHVATVEDARQFVARRHAEGVDHLKIVLRGLRRVNEGTPNLDESRVRALAEAVHMHGLVAVAHVETLDDVRVALAGGVDGLVHTWRQEGADPVMARQVVERGVFVMPILVGPDSFLPEGRAGILADPRLQNALSEPIKEQLALDQSYPAVPITAAPIDVRRANRDAAFAATRSLREAGARFVVGSDASHITPVAFGVSFHRELELLSHVGLSPVEILAAATSSTADAFRLRDRGRIAAGLRADLVLVRGDPTADILATRGLLRVWKAGVEVELVR